MPPRKRKCCVNLPDEFLNLCEELEVPPETVLRGFIADVCGIMNWAASPREDGYSSNGSDERDMAWAYVMRQGYAMDWQERTQYWKNPGQRSFERVDERPKRTRKLETPSPT